MADQDYGILLTLNDLPLTFAKNGLSVTFDNRFAKGSEYFDQSLQHFRLQAEQDLSAGNYQRLYYSYIDMAITYHYLKLKARNSLDDQRISRWRAPRQSRRTLLTLVSLAVTGAVIGGCAVFNYQPTYWIASLPWSIPSKPDQSSPNVVDVLRKPLTQLGFQQLQDYEDRGQSYAVFSIGIGLFTSERLDVTIKRSTNQINIRDFRVPYESDFLGGFGIPFNLN